MCNTATDVFANPKQADSLIRADALEREITDLCAQINAASYRLLQLIAELDDTGPWGTWGLQSCAHWLNWRCGIGMNAAREKVRVAHALKSLPAISSAFESGRLSFSKVRALTRIADGANEAELLELAFHATAAQVEKLVRAYRGVSRRAEREQAMISHAARELNYYHDDDGCLVIRARLPAEEGAVVLQALNAAMDARHAAKNDVAVNADAENAETADDVTAETSENENRFAQRRADALTAMAETALRHGPESQSSGERYQVVVHVTAETLTEDEGGRSELNNGQRIAPDTERCDPATVDAAFRGALMTASSMLITFDTGRTAARPRPITSFYCVAVITAWCTRAGLGSNGSHAEHYSSPDPTAKSSPSIRGCPRRSILTLSAASRSTRQTGLSPETY